MYEFSFFYRPEIVYELSLKALQRKKKFEVIYFDQTKRTIFAKQKSTWVRPEIELQIYIHAISEQQTEVEVKTILKKKGLTIKGKNKAELQFFQSLFNCFDILSP